MKFRVSNFLLTLNTNVRFGPDEDLTEFTDGLYQLGQFLFGDAERAGNYVTFPKGGEWDDRHIVSVDSTFKCEIGHNLRGQRLHLHGVVKIRHHSFIQLNIPLIKSLGNEFLSSISFPFPIQHINVKAGRPSFEDYIDEGEINT